MKTKHTLWLGILFVIAAVIAVAFPGSPVYLPAMFVASGSYEGHSTRFWVNALEGPDGPGRLEAIHAVGLIGAEAADAVPILAGFLEHADPDMRTQSALALSKMTPASKSAVAALGQALSDPHPRVRINAGFALFKLREEARPAIPALVEALKDETNNTNAGQFHFTIVEISAMALGRASAGTADAVPALAEALEAAKTPETRRAILQALGEIGASARPAEPQVRELLKDRSEAVREAAGEALKKIEGT